MTAPAAARSNKWNDRVYPVPKPGTLEMVELPSVTSLLSVIAKPGLERWKQWKLAQALSLRPDWVVLAGSGDLVKGVRTGAKDAVKQADDADQSSANRGTGIHYFTEQVDDDSLMWEMVPEPIKGAVAGYAQAKEDFGWELVRKEFTCYSHTYGYAGTADRFLCFPTLSSKTHTADVKAGKDVYADYGLQMACYTFSDGIWVPPASMPKADAATDELQKDISAGVNVPPTATGKARKSWNQAAIKAAEAELQELYWDEYASLGTHLPLPEDLCEDVAYVLHVGETETHVVPLHISGLRSAVAGVPALHAFINNKGIVGDPISSNRTPTSAPIASGAPEEADQDASPDSASDVAPQPISMLDLGASAGDTDSDVHGFEPAEDDPCYCGEEDFEPSTEIPVAEPAPRAERVQVLRDRIGALVPVAKQKLAFNWPAGTPTFKQSSDQSEEQLEQLDRILWEIECEFVTPEETSAAIHAIENAFPGSITN